MYKLVIVDDEIDFRGRITKIVEKSNTGFNLVGVYENGLDAYDGVVQHNPDILITDIKMPFMDGITLIKTLKKDFPLLKVIIVSGFDEFDYAKEAIDLGVISYITKPITTKELEQILEKTKKDLDIANQEKNEFNSLVAFKEQNYKKICSDELNSWLDLRLENENTNKTLQSLNICLDYKMLVLCNIELDNNDREVDTGILIENIITETLDGIYEFETFTRGKSNFVIIKDNVGLRQNDLSYKLNEIIIKTQKFLNKSITIAVSSFNNKTIIPYEMYNQCRQALLVKKILSGGVVLLYDNLDFKNYDEVNFDSDIQQIKSAIRAGVYNDIEQILMQMKNKMEVSNIRSTKSNYILSTVINLVLSMCQNQSLLYSKYESSLDIYEDLMRASSLSDAFDIIAKVANIVVDINRNLIINQVDRKLEQILEYIDLNYNKSIVLDDVADKMDLTSNYICSLLKKHRNTTFVKYLTKIRMEKAIELLQTKKYKIVDISMMVGYEDPFYFSHCFKKQMGISPKEFLNKQ